MVTAKRVAIALALACAVYVVLAVRLGLAFVEAGGLVALLLGLAIVVVPLIAAWLIWREVRFGLALQSLGEELGARGELPRDDLPRLPSGRADLAAADEEFERCRAEVELAPQDAGAWYRLGIAYDDARDRKAARAAMRRAVELHESVGLPPRD